MDRTYAADDHEIGSDPLDWNRALEAAWIGGRAPRACPLDQADYAGPPVFARPRACPCDLCAARRAFLEEIR